jgi:hypothetical protein
MNSGASTLALPPNCSTLGRQQAFLQEIQAFTSPSLLLNPSTPQGMAFKWIFANDVTTDPCVSAVVTAQRYGLAVFYYATNGASWTNKSNWMSSASECTWYGVTCGTDGSVTNLKLGMYALKEVNLMCLRLTCNSLSHI